MQIADEARPGDSQESYKRQRRSKFSQNSMHPKNRKELLKYPRFCWILLVRYDVLV